MFLFFIINLALLTLIIVLRSKTKLETGVGMKILFGFGAFCSFGSVVLVGTDAEGTMGYSIIAIILYGIYILKTHLIKEYRDYKIAPDKYTNEHKNTTLKIKNSQNKYNVIFDNNEIKYTKLIIENDSPKTINVSKNEINDLILQRHKKINIEYKLDDLHMNKYNDFNNSLNEVVRSKKQWYVSSRVQNNNIKASLGGASSLIDNKEIIVSYCTPPDIKLNIRTVGIPLNKKKIYFLPDRLILVVNGKDKQSIDYSNLSIQIRESRFIWAKGRKPSDSVMIDVTYAHMNTKGGPDRRYSYNPAIPVLSFTEISFFIPDILNESIMISKSNGCRDLIKAFNSLKNCNIENTSESVKDGLLKKINKLNYIIQLMDDKNLGYQRWLEKNTNKSDLDNNTMDIYRFCMFTFINYIVNSNLTNADFEIIKNYLGTHFGNIIIENESSFNLVFGKEMKNEKTDPIDWYVFEMQNDDVVVNNPFLNKKEKIIDCLVDVYKGIGLKIVKNGNGSVQREKRYNEYLKYCNNRLSEIRNTGESKELRDSLPVKKMEEDVIKPELIDDNITLEELINQLNGLIGLESVKNDVNSLINLIKVRKIREEKNIKQEPMSLHLVFSGNPGTGKTTVARLIAKIYHKIGVLSKGVFIEADRSDLVGGYVGQTAIKVKDICNKALGGILFIDEAYSLTSNREDSDYGKEAIDTLLKFMEDNRDDFIVIVAGYTDLMENFLESNPGLKSRFNKFINFEDYTPEELFKIYQKNCNDSELVLDKEAEEYIKMFFKKRYENRTKNFANARDVRNYFEKTLVNQANRIAQDGIIANDELQIIKYEDIKDIKLKD